MIEDILFNNLNIEKTKTLTEENIILSKKYQNSKKVLTYLYLNKNNILAQYQKLILK